MKLEFDNLNRLYNHYKYWQIGLIICSLSFWGSLSTSLFAQGHNGLFGNEWIDYSPGKKYYKIKVTQDGMYRVSAAVLQQAGANLSSLNVAGIQVFHQGKEIPIQVESSGGVLSYVQFYGEKNRGDFDVNCYNEASHHFNEAYSLYTDTSAYFLTWDNTPSTEHYTTVGANLSNLPAKEQYFMHTNRVVYSSSWNEGLTWQVSTERLSKSTFEYGEGFGSSLAISRSTTVPSEHPYNSGPNATGSIKAFTAGDHAHVLNIKSGGTVYATHSFNAWKVDKFSASLPASIIQTGGTDLTAQGTANGSDKYFIAYAELTYPRLFNFDGNYIFPFSIAAHNNRKYIELNNIDNTNAGQNKFYLYDLTNKTRIQCFYDAANTRLLTDLTPSSQDRELVLINEGNSNSYTNVLAVETITFRNFSSSIFTPINYVIVTHPSLKSNSLGADPIFDYRAYRQSVAGGSYQTLEVSINELYDQFAYGISTHPLAIRHFAHYIKQNWIDPEYLYLIGKGRIYADIRTNKANLLLPTFGYPPSDHVLVASIQSDEPAIAVGRLSASTGDQVSAYLQKIKDVEAERAAPQTIADRGWTKNLLHLGGGKNSNEQNIIRYHLNTMKNTIEAPLYGGYVQSFFKSSTNPIQAAQSSYLDSLINSGVSMITFFGHSSANSFDFNLDHPQNYSNYKKYPLIMALGCYGGTMFAQTPLISEDFIFEPQAGAGVFLASSSAAALEALNQFAQHFYTGIGNTHYNEGAAKSAKSAIRALENASNYTTTNQMACHYMTYHGDPAYQVSTATHPDYYIDNSLVSHSPDIVTVQMNTFNLELDVYNIGKAIDTVFNIRVERIFPNGTSAFVTSQQVSAPLFRSNITIPVPVGNSEALGINKFNIYIDADNDIDEQPNPAAENNNEVIQYCVAILSDAIVPVYPYEFAIVPNAPITLKASTGNAFALPQTYAIQIDTTAYFNSPLLEQTTISQVGGLVEWTPSMSYLDSVVYYWRVSIDSTNPSVGYTWSNSSFIYINGSYPGWNQSHFFQYLKDDHTNIYIEEPDRQFKFINSIQEVSATTAQTPSVMHPENVALYFNGSKLDKCRCPNKNGIYVSVIEPGTLNFWKIPGFSNQYGAINCDAAGRISPTFLFETNTAAGRDSLENFISNVIPNDYYVLVYTLNNPLPIAWNSSLINAFKDEGAWYIDDWVANSTPTSSPPWGTFFKKGDSSYVHKSSMLGAHVNDVLTISGLLQENWFQGAQTSTIIGPANYWGSMHWQHSNLTNDRVSVEVFGLDANQNVRTRLIGPTTNLVESLTSIDPNQYPYLELVWNTLDSINRTSAQLDYWRVIADMVPEAALRPELFVTLDSSCIQQGREIKLSIAMENISPLDMDSMLVKFEIIGSGLVKYARLDSLRTGDTLHADVSFPTLSLQGSNHQLLVEINPNGDQPEQYHFNNIGLAAFKLQQDVINPVLDVTFDGIHIMNKDIVSGTPEIVITLADENPYLGLENLEDFSIILRHPSLPNGEMFLSPSTTDMQFYPADPSKLNIENKARIVIHPDLQADGIYTLFVSAADRSGNNSGNLSYSVDFEVINKPSISNMLNYPNPFSTSTQFVFTLTGRELPDYMKIQILTVTGKVVREIMQEELGTLRIGINRTEYAWDGKDEYGDQLANGVYLYRVITKRDGADYDIYSNRTDYMFRQGFGKMYLMR
ncbi:putative type IX secretion system sortase PorU2 [Aureispira anguillae]|uniref:C25 family cysteine peptidase n=1 Tax=Aureispira anguillae TaxID=2864201 RepID=A0A915YIB3_9BACT|nr:C25 family cysteine peptidase [Aureispira anguillae]BDS13534.1 C25 family cysteine peptidase [Aureispira anguillae]